MVKRKVSKKQANLYCTHPYNISNAQIQNVNVKPTEYYILWQNQILLNKVNSKIKKIQLPYKGSTFSALCSTQGNYTGNPKWRPSRRHICRVSYCISGFSQGNCCDLVQLLLLSAPRNMQKR